MKIYKFKECNWIYGESQPEYLPLPVHRKEDGEVISCWKCSFLERIKLLFTGKVYFSVLTFNAPLQPQLVSIKNPVKGE